MIFKNQTKALLDSKSKVNIISQAFIIELGLKIRKTNIDTQKNNSTTLKIYRIIVSIFSISDKDDREKIFEKNFLLADIKLDIVVEILFVTISNTNVNFQA